MSKFDVLNTGLEAVKKAAERVGAIVNGVKEGTRNNLRVLLAGAALVAWGCNTQTDQPPTIESSTIEEVINEPQGEISKEELLQAIGFKDPDTPIEKVEIIIAGVEGGQAWIEGDVIKYRFDPGSKEMSIRVTIKSGRYTKEVTITIAYNNPPEVNPDASLPEKTVEWGYVVYTDEEILEALQATDPDGDKVEIKEIQPWYWVAAVERTSDGWKIVPEDGAVEGEIEVTLTDDKWAERVVKVKIRFNYPPTWNPEADLWISLEPGSQTSLSLQTVAQKANITDLDDGLEGLTWSLVSTSHPFIQAEIRDGNLIITVGEDVPAGEHYVEIKAEDPQGEEFRVKLTFTVEAVDNPAQIEGGWQQPEITVREEGVFEIDVTDPDGIEEVKVNIRDPLLWWASVLEETYTVGGQTSFSTTVSATFGTAWPYDAEVRTVDVTGNAYEKGPFTILVKPEAWIDPDVTYKDLYFSDSECWGYWENECWIRLINPGDYVYVPVDGVDLQKHEGRTKVRITILHPSANDVLVTYEIECDGVNCIIGDGMLKISYEGLRWLEEWPYDVGKAVFEVGIVVDEEEDKVIRSKPTDPTEPLGLNYSEAFSPSSFRAAIGAWIEPERMAVVVWRKFVVDREWEVEERTKVKGWRFKRPSKKSA